MKHNPIVLPVLLTTMVSLSGCLWTGQPIDLRHVDCMHKGQDDVNPIAGKKKFPKAQKQEMAESKPKQAKPRKTYSKAKKTATAQKEATKEVAELKSDMAEASAAAEQKAGEITSSTAQNADVASAAEKTTTVE